MSEMRSTNRSRSRSPRRPKVSGGFRWKEKKPRNNDLPGTSGRGSYERGYREEARRDRERQRARQLNKAPDRSRPGDDASTGSIRRQWEEDDERISRRKTRQKEQNVDEELIEPARKRRRTSESPDGQRDQVAESIPSHRKQREAENSLKAARADSTSVGVDETEDSTDDDLNASIDAKFGPGASLKVSAKTKTAASNSPTIHSSQTANKSSSRPKQAQDFSSSSNLMQVVKINDRLGTKAEIPCLPTDTIGDFKKLVAMKIGRKPHEIMLKRQSMRPFKDFLTLADYEVGNGASLDLELGT